MKKFIVTLNADWNVLKFEFSKQDDACKFMSEAVKASTLQIKCTLEVEDITNEEEQDN